MKPDFFIVGAPKCGTTAMTDYLNQHPDVFVPVVKEPDFFGSDLTGRRYTTNLHTYLALFEPGRGKLCGEGSTAYIISKQAAQEIYNFNPEAKIIIMIRNPVDMLYSLHNQVVYTGDESIHDFALALAAEPNASRVNIFRMGVDSLNPCGIVKTPTLPNRFSATLMHSGANRYMSSSTMTLKQIPPLPTAPR
ncbi:MAG: sulfotransferase domain-containing protein [Chloroflexaceae bacterium]|nr:sulfotransferase domain-containing protein [Chloroflexaceae bacterium]